MGKPSVALIDKELVDRIRQGDTVAEGLLMHRHYGLVVRAINKFSYPPTVDLDDVIQDGLLALMATARDLPPKGWDYTTGVKFSTYAHQRIIWAGMKNWKCDSLQTGEDELDNVAARPPAEHSDLMEIGLTPLERGLALCLIGQGGSEVRGPVWYKPVRLKDAAAPLGLEISQAMLILRGIRAKLLVHRH